MWLALGTRCLAVGLSVFRIAGGGVIRFARFDGLLPVVP